MFLFFNGESVHFPTEFLNSLEISGLPPHTLTLKKGCPVMVLGSLDPPFITNGTRCIVQDMYPNAELPTQHIENKEN